MRLIAATVALLALPFGVEAQGSRMSKVGVLENDLTRFDAFRQELRKLGWQEKKNVTFEIRTGRDEELPRLAAGLVTSKVDVIFAPTSAAVQASKAATAKIPIVFATAADPVGSGFVARLGSPGGNVSGLTSIFAELNGKRLELLKVVIPGTKRVAVLANFNGVPYNAAAVQEVERAASALEIQVQVLEWSSTADLERVFAGLTRARVDAIIVLPHPAIWPNRARIAELAIKQRLPTVFPAAEHAEAGGLMSYGPSLLDLYRRAAVYVDKILRGAVPADLPVEQPTKIDLAINLKTAKAIGVTVPEPVLVRADYIIK